MNHHLKRSTRSLGQITALSLAIAVTSGLEASSHREAPYIGKFPQVDASDFYMFNSYEPGRDGYVTILANYIPVQAAYGGPNYYPLDEEALYEIHIDNDGDAIEDITFQFDFETREPEAGLQQFSVGEGANQKQIDQVLKNVGGITADAANGLGSIETYELTIVSGDRRSGNSVNARNLSSGGTEFAKPFDYTGTKTFGGPGRYTEYANSFIHNMEFAGCAQPAKVFVGQRHEAFKIGLGEVFDLINFVPVEGDSAPGAGDAGGFPGGVTQSAERNALIRNNMTTIAIEVHQDCITGDGNGVVGGWTSASLRQATLLNPRPATSNPEVALGPFTQVSRLGNFLVNELFIGLADKDQFNSSEPKDDAQFADYVTHPVFPEIVNSLFLAPVNSTLGANLDTLAPKNIPRQDLVAGFLTGVDGLNQLSIITPSEMLRLNTAIPATPRNLQSPLGVAAGDLAGFPNGRRPGDDSVDIALRAAMGVLCHDLPIGTNGDLTNLGLCSPDDAVIGDRQLTDGVPIAATEFNNSFPYLLTPYPGSAINSPIPQPTN